MAYQPVRHQRVISADSLTPLTAAIEPQPGDDNQNNHQSIPYVNINDMQAANAGTVPQQPDQIHPVQQPLYADQQQFMTTNTTMATTKALRSNKCPSKANISLKMAFPQTNNQQPSPSPMSASPASGEKQRKHANRQSNVSTSSSKSDSKLSAIFSQNGTWTYETISMLVALGAVASIIAVLATYDGQPLPSWPHWITLNAVIAILATVATASMSVPLSSGLGQLKWIRFKQGRAPLSDMEIYDDASRGALGAVNMLVRARGGFAGSFGAVVMINPSGAVNYRTETYGLALHGKGELGQAFVPILPIKAAVYKGLFAEDGRPWMGLPFQCSTGNCTFPPIETLGVCHKCVDIQLWLALPSGAAKLNSSDHVFGMTSLFPGSATGDATYSTIMKLIFMGTETNATGPGPITNDTVPSLSSLSSSINALEPLTIQSPTNSSLTYSMSMQSILAMQSWFSRLFANGTASRNPNYINQTISKLPSLNSSPNVVVNLTVGISSGETFFDTDIVQAFYWNYYEYPSPSSPPKGLEMLMSDLAVALTSTFRTLTAVPINGTSLSYETFVSVRWGFVALPVTAVILAAVFLGLAAWETKRSGASLWKTSALAMLFHGLDEDARERLRI
ncbi:hypothetical protein B0T13DRAFT_498598 [Neurospora crassa]|nr:hypothetical protein B0T13DRAFT_498598 [Neurospora crassa]